MRPGMADAAERDEIFRGIVCRVKVDMMDVEIIIPTADGAPPSVTTHDRGPHLLPSPEGVLLPRPDGYPELLAEDGSTLADGERAAVAEPEKAVPLRMAAAEGREPAVKRIEVELHPEDLCQDPA